MLGRTGLEVSVLAWAACTSPVQVPVDGMRHAVPSIALLNSV